MKFQTRLILNLYGITFHPAVVLGPEHDFLFKYASTYGVVALQPSLSRLFILLPQIKVSRKIDQPKYTFDSTLRAHLSYRVHAKAT